MAFAPPIARDGFHYNGDLYVEVGNLNRHKRASIPEITTILRPDLKKPKNAAAASPPKDPVGHWYEAQLIHYGLPPSKDKARAKMRLLEALNSSKLVVPAWIEKLEGDMKKEYAAADRKAKAQYKASITAAGQSKDAASGKKRKQSEATTNSINVNINFGPYGTSQFPMMPHAATTGFDGAHADEAPKKKAKKSAVSAPTTAGNGKTKAGSDPAPKPARKKQTARKSSTLSAQSSSNVGHRFDDEDVAAQVALAEMMSPKKKATAPKPSPAAKSNANTKPTAKVKKETSVKKEPVIKNEPTPTKKAPTAKSGAPSIKKDPDIKPSSSQPKLGLINGYYTITCPTISEEFPSFATDLSLILCLDSPGLWGSYDFGMFSGILHMQERPWEPSPQGIRCLWRGRENSEGERSFGDSCVGEVAFLGNGQIEGWLNVYGQCWFQGIRRPGGTAAPRSAASMRDEWEGYCEEAYEEERVGRW